MGKNNSGAAYNRGYYVFYRGCNVYAGQSVKKFIEAGIFPDDVIITRRQAIMQRLKVFRPGRKCGKCGAVSWRAVISWACINCKIIKKKGSAL